MKLLLLDYGGVSQMNCYSSLQHVSLLNVDSDKVTSDKVTSI